MSSAIPAVNFGAGPDFALGVEEELLLVHPVTHALRHAAVEVLAQLETRPDAGRATGETYLALLELVTPVCADAGEAVAALSALRGQIRAAGATVIGSGLHPDGAFGEAPHFPTERYQLISAEMRGLLERTPTAALHVHIGMPDADTAVRVYSGIRAHLPLLQALAANSPFWHGRDSGLASARAQLFRAFPRSEVPPSFRSWAAYAEHVELTCAAGALPDYTFLWWDVRLHPVLGTVEVRAMDAQSSLDTVAGITALVHGLARMAADDHGPYERSDVLAESSFRAARDGIDATIWHQGALRPVAIVAREVLARVRPYAREVGSDAALEEVERVLVEGGGARRRRAAYARGGMHAMLADLVAETSLRAPFYAPAAR